MQELASPSMLARGESKEVDTEGQRKEWIETEYSVDCVVKASPAFSGVEGGLCLARKEPLDDPPGPLDTPRTTGDRNTRRRRYLRLDLPLTFQVLEDCLL